MGMQAIDFDLKNIGERIVLAARLATAEHLRRSVQGLIEDRDAVVAAATVRMKQQTEVGGADSNGVTDDPQPSQPDARRAE
jgi:hypothetical protein